MEAGVLYFLIVKKSTQTRVNCFFRTSKPHFMWDCGFNVTFNHNIVSLKFQ